MKPTREVIRRYLTISDTCTYVGESRSTLYQEAKSGRLTMLKFGRKTLIEISELDRYAAAKAKPLHVINS